MAQDDEFRIKGAAQISDLPEPVSSETPNQSEEPSENADQAEEAEEAQSKGKQNAVEVVEKEENSDEEEKKGEEEEKKKEEEEELEQASYKWFKCENPSQVPGTPAHYYTNTETGASSWEEPAEPYWLYNTELAGPDPCGLQYPSSVERLGAGQRLAATHPLQYNPKIHGNYDPNADYAKYTSQRLAEQSGYNNTATIILSGSADYTTTMALNARTGAAQPSHLTADRHNDAAKSGRQMNAFFDVDAAANAHEGKSLKEERKNKKLSKADVKAFNEARKEKKQKKRMAFYKS